MMLTHCPYCSTTFRVTAEQLKIRQGQVRCGQCRRVFDALRALDENVARAVPAPRPAEPAREEVLSWTMVQPAPPGADDGYHEPITITGFDVVPTRQPEPVVEPVVEVPAGFVPVAAAAVEPPLEFTPVEETAAVVEAPSEVPPAVVPAVEPEPESPPDDEGDIEHIDLDVDPRGPLTEPPAEPEPPREPQAKPATDSRPRFAPARFEPDPPTILDLHNPLPVAPPSWPWLLGSLIALLLLGAQLLIHYRTEIVASRPDARPAFVAACELLGCQITLPHKIDLIGIDASDLAPDEKRPGTLRLTATLRNRAPYAQAWPQLEITLTDAQERPLLRRTLAPTEYLPAEVAPAQGFPARSEQALQLTLTATDVPAIGYRLYVFHP